MSEATPVGKSAASAGQAAVPKSSQSSRAPVPSYPAKAPRNTPTPEGESAATAGQTAVPQSAAGVMPEPTAPAPSAPVSPAAAPAPAAGTPIPAPIGAALVADSADRLAGNLAVMARQTIASGMTRMEVDPRKIVQLCEHVLNAPLPMPGLRDGASEAEVEAWRAEMRAAAAKGPPEPEVTPGASVPFAGPGQGQG